METAQEDGDQRSPKRQAHDQRPVQTPSGSALDAAIWTSIIEFLPMPKDVILSIVKTPWSTQITYSDALISQVVATWRTLLNLRLVSKEVATLLHPVENKTLWKKLLLQSFEFSVDGAFNVENQIDDFGLDIPVGEEQEDLPTETTAPLQGPTDGHRGKDPQLVAMRGRYHGTPYQFLEEDLANWSKLGIYHRPSQYGFLAKLQQQPPVGQWPASEDPFTLFADVVRLLMLPHGAEMGAGGEASDPIFKCLAAPSEADSSSTYFRFYVMKTLGIVPHFWHWGRGIGDEWKGTTDPEAFDASIAEQLAANKEEDSDEDDDDSSDEDDNDEDDVSFEDGDFGFPSCTVLQATRLYQNLRQHCQDWRSVCCNHGSDGSMPVFFVGESKAIPHRWIGYAGRKCWT